MTTFAEKCVLQRAKAATTLTYVGMVVRLNQDEKLVFTLHNEEYDTSHPGASLQGQEGRRRDPVTHLGAFRPFTSDDFYATTPSGHKKISTASAEAIAENADFSTELAMWVNQENMKRRPVGLIVTESEKAKKLAELRGQARRNADKIREDNKCSVEDEWKENRDRRSARLDYEREFEREFRSEHGHGRPYPPGSNTGSPVLYGQGGHTEEILIREWTAMTAGVKSLAKVEIYLSRMPCAHKSSPFRMNFGLGTIVFKQGCMTKLIQLVDAVGKGVTWDIRYTEALWDTRELGLSQLFAKGLPANVLYRQGIFMPRFHDG